MSKYSAYGIALEVGTSQTEYAVLATDAAAITGAGNGAFTVTHAGLAGSPLATDVGLLVGDTPTNCATKAAVGLNAVGAISTHGVMYSVGINLYYRIEPAAANDATLNIAYADNGSAGLTDDAGSENGVAGVVLAEIAQVTNIGGPGLGLDIEDVTTHDQATSWEETVATILRSGEITLDIVYDPSDGTHDATTGLVYRHEDKIFSNFNLVFPDAVNWAFNGYVTGFEPTGGIASALTATVKVKIHGAPTLE